MPGCLIVYTVLATESEREYWIAIGTAVVNDERSAIEVRLHALPGSRDARIVIKSPAGVSTNSIPTLTTN